MLQIGFVENAFSEDLATESTLSRFHYYDVLVEGNATYALTSTPIANAQVFTNPDGSKFPVQEIWLLKIDNSTRKITFAPKIGDYAASHGVLSISGDSIRVAFNYKSRSGDYAMDAKMLSWNKTALVATLNRTIFIGANCGWYPRFPDTSTAVEHFCYAGYLRYKDTTFVSSAQPSGMAQEYSDILKAHSQGIVPKTTDAEVVQALLKSFPANVVTLAPTIPITAPLASGGSSTSQMKEISPISSECNSENWAKWVEEIPCLMDKKGWTLAPKLMRRWFKGDASNYLITFDDVIKTGSTTNVVDALNKMTDRLTKKSSNGTTYCITDLNCINEDVSFWGKKATKTISQGLVDELNKNKNDQWLAALSDSNKGGKFDFNFIESESNLIDSVAYPDEWDKMSWVAEKSLEPSKIDEFTSAFGYSTIRAVFKGKVAMSDSTKGIITITITQISAYFRDSYDFLDEDKYGNPKGTDQFLGCWRRTPPYVDVNIADYVLSACSSDWTTVKNSSFTKSYPDHRSRNFLIFSKPKDKIVYDTENNPNLKPITFDHHLKGDLNNLKLDCPDQVTENTASAKRCTVKAVYDFADGKINAEKDVTTSSKLTVGVSGGVKNLVDLWNGQYVDALTVDKTGNLIANKVPYNTEFTITASYTEKGVTKEATAIVQVNKTPVAPVITTPVVSTVPSKNNPVIKTPVDNQQGINASNVRLSWDLNNPNNNALVNDVKLTLREFSGYKGTAGNYVGGCQNKSIGKADFYLANNCGTLKPNQWYKWFVGLYFTDGLENNKGVEGYFMTAPATTPALTLTALTSNCPTTTLNSGGNATCKAIATYSDSSTKDVTASTTWSSNNTAALTVSQGNLVAGNVSQNTTVGIKVSYTEKTTTKTSVLNVTVLKAVDTENPKGSISPSIDTSYTQGDQITVKWSVTDNMQLAKVSFNVAPAGSKTPDSKVSMTPVTTGWTDNGKKGSGVHYIDTSKLSDTYYYALWVTDAAGNGKAQPVYQGSFTVKEKPDTVNPTGQLTTSIKPSYVKGERVTVGWSASDNKQLAKVSFNVAPSGSKTPIDKVSMTPVTTGWKDNGTRGAGSYQMDTGLLTAGTYYYALWVADAAGNGGNAKAQPVYQGSFTVTVPPPQVTQVYPLTVPKGKLATFKVTGSNLPDTLAFHLKDCPSPTLVGSRSATMQKFSCTPSYTTGVKDGNVNDKTGGSTLKPFKVNVTTK